MSTNGELGALVEAWRDRRDPRPSDAWIGRKVGASSRSTVGPWLRGESMPRPQQLRKLASLIGVSYRTVLDAALLDAGYLEEREYRDNTAPMNVTEADAETLMRDSGLPTEGQTPRAPDTPDSAQP